MPRATLLSLLVTHCYAFALQMGFNVLRLVPQSCLTRHDSWTVARQASLSLGLSRKKHWSGLPFPSPGRDGTWVFCISGGFFTGLLPSGKSRISTSFISQINQLYLSDSNCDTPVDMRPEFSSVCKCNKNITSCQLAHTGIKPTTLTLLAPHSNQLS